MKFGVRDNKTILVLFYLLKCWISQFLIKKFQSRNVHTSYNIGYFDNDMDDVCSSGFWGTRTTFCTLCSLTGDAVWNTNLDLVVMIENWYPKSTSW